MTAADHAIRSIGLPAHPEPSVIADALEATAKLLRQNGVTAVDLAHVLAQRGYPTGTLGDGGSRSSDRTSVPERNAYRPGDKSDDGKPIPPPPQAKWWGIDLHTATLLRDLWRNATRTTATVNELIAHADDVDPTPAGTGSCRACSRTCRPDAHRPGNRLRSGLCPTCYRAWKRHSDQDDNPMLWSDWVAKRRESFTERDATGRTVVIHTPEPDHDLDLSR